MREFKIGDRVEVVKDHLYKGEANNYLKVGDVGEIVDLGTNDPGAFHVSQREFHVKVKADGKDSTWIQINCLELVDAVEDAEYQLALASIGLRDRALTFEEIVFRDKDDNKFILRPADGHSVELTNEKGEFVMILDRVNWTNMSGLMMLALTAAEDV